MKKVILILIAVTVICLIALRVAYVIGEKNAIRAESSPNKVIPVEAGNLAPSSIVEKAYQRGNIVAREEVSLYSKVSGRLVRNLVQMNDPVSPNQVVAVIDRDEIGFEFNQFEVRSDARGTVAKVFANPGAHVNQSNPLFHIVAIDTVKAVIGVAEDKIRFVRIGQTAKVTIQAYPELLFSGKVSNISPLANAVNRTVDVEISIPNPQQRLKPGMSAEAELTLERRNALLAPLSALAERAGKKVVFVIDDSSVLMRPVSTGDTVGDSIEIMGGLRPEEMIVVTGSHLLNDRDRVVVTNQSEARKNTTP
jgi:multidrug efflux pump subunit AcrA (membrane-fusion protein)